MKRLALLCVCLALLFAGCVYEAPLTTQHAIAVDPALFGYWELVPEPGDKSDQRERVLVLRYSDTEYMLGYESGESMTYFRAYPVNIAGIASVQLEFIGTNDGPVEPREKNRFHVAMYRLTGDKLEVTVLNTDLVKVALTTTDSLQSAFLANTKNEALFHNPGVFRRIGG